METLGDKICSLRKSKNFSQEELAFQLGVSRQTISKWEANIRQPNAENIMQLCSVFNVSADYFLIDQTLKPAVNDNNSAVSEITFTEVAITECKPKKNYLLIIGIVIDAVCLLALAIASIIVGHIVFSPNKGVENIKLVTADLSIFIVLILTFVTLLIIEILLIYFLIKRKKCKM